MKCVCVYIGRWNDCKVIYVMGMNIGVLIFFLKINFIICGVFIELKKKEFWIFYICR